MRAGLAVAVLVYLVYSSFGIAHPCLWGHLGHHQAEYMLRVRSTFRHHLVTPATHAGYDVPPAQDYYLHHPIGYHHALGLFTLLVGDHLWTATVFPAATGLLALWALYALTRRFWSREAALLAVAAWVALPFVWSFSILTDAMFPAMACSLVTCRAWLEYREAPSRRWLAIALVAELVGGLLFWEAYLQAGLHGLQALAWWLSRRGSAARGAARPHALAWIAATGGLAAALLGGHFLLVASDGMWGDFVTSYRIRHDTTLALVGSTQWRYLDLLYGRPLLAVGAVWLVWFIARAATGRARLRDQAVLLFLIMNLIYVYLFAGAANVHLYRVFWCSSFLVLALCDLATAARRRLTRTGLGPRGATATVAALLCAYFAVTTRHAIQNLLESRATMGTHMPTGYDAQYGKHLFAQVVARFTERSDFVFIHSDLPQRVEFGYALDRSNALITSLAELPDRLARQPHAVLIMDGFPSENERRLLFDLLRHHPASLFDRYLFVDLRSDRPEFHEYTFAPQPPRLGWRWWVSHRFPQMKTRETLTLYAQRLYVATWTPPPAGLPEPPVPRHTPDELAIFHDYNLLRGRDDLVAWARGEIERGAQPCAVALPFAKLFAVAAVSQGGAIVWMERTGEPSAPLHFGWMERTGQPSASLHFHLAPLDGGAAIELREAPVGDRTLDETRPGALYGASLSFAAPAGRYRLSVDDGAPHPIGVIEIQ